jgi:anti-sigma regulatory factor (Ser/Thr protein kinase)
MSGPTDGGMSVWLVLDVVADEWNATLVRGRFRTWLGSDAASPHGQDLTFAVYEAVSNIVRHAYRDGGVQSGRLGRMRLRAHRATDGITVTIADDGVWRAPQLPGRGLRLIRGLVTRARIERGGIDTPGTKVHLYAALNTPRG